MKHCKVCNQEKQYNPAKPRGTKSSGFQGAVCWDCFVVAQRARAQGFDPADPAYAEFKELRLRGRNLRVYHAEQALEARVKALELKVVARRAQLAVRIAQYEAHKAATQAYNDGLAKAELRAGFAFADLRGAEVDCNGVEVPAEFSKLKRP